MDRSSGIILPVSSLPSPYGIGTLGASARSFVDFLAAAGQSWWQMLPVGPTSFGDSPYQSPSTFAGNPYFIDLDELVAAGLLTQDEVDELPWGDDPAQVDYAAIYTSRDSILRRAFARGWERDHELVEGYVDANNMWLPDYALFMALKRHFGMASWIEWPEQDVRLREPAALDHYRQELASEISYVEFVQFLFAKQWRDLRAYARSKGVGIIGDIPIYVALDSSDVWAEPQYFQLDKDNLPTGVAGVPPDYFSADGQLWGNPLYDYDAMAKDGFVWWKRRIAGMSRLYDVIRIDHFRGFASYWDVPYGDDTARNGKWVKGPGMKLIGELIQTFPNLEFIAEDLGYPTPEVAQLLEDSGFPGMKVLEFAFDSRDDAGDLGRPHAFPRHCVCYTGTHDNAPLMEWRGEVDPEDLRLACRYIGINEREGFNWGFIRAGMGSVADLFVAQMQDYLELGAESRMNTPGTLGNNWKWRLVDGQITSELAEHIADITRMYGRSARH